MAKLANARHSKRRGRKTLRVQVPLLAFNNSEHRPKAAWVGEVAMKTIWADFSFTLKDKQGRPVYPLNTLGALEDMEKLNSPLTVGERILLTDGRTQKEAQLDQHPYIYQLWVARPCHEDYAN